LADAAEVDTIWPGHGPVLDEALPAIEYYLRHRAERLDQVRQAVAAGAREPLDVVRTVYADVDERLWPAAELSVRAQLDYLREHG
jgi:glyoxylase-like metal-dependent hydrolase (beta-lactamase superfamily II)